MNFNPNVLGTLCIFRNNHKAIVDHLKSHENGDEMPDLQPLATSLTEVTEHKSEGIGLFDCTQELDSSSEEIAKEIDGSQKTIKDMQAYSEAPAGTNTGLGVLATSLDTLDKLFSISVGLSKVYPDQYISEAEGAELIRLKIQHISMGLLRSIAKIYNQVSEQGQKLLSAKIKELFDNGAALNRYLLRYAKGV